MRVGSTSFNLLQVSSKIFSVVAQSIQPSVTETPYWSWDRSAGMDCLPKLILLSSMKPISDWLHSRIWRIQSCSARGCIAPSVWEYSWLQYTHRLVESFFAAKACSHSAIVTES